MKRLLFMLVCIALLAELFTFPAAAATAKSALYFEQKNETTAADRPADDAVLPSEPADGDAYDGYIVKLREDMPAIQTFSSDLSNTCKENLMVVDSLEEVWEFAEEYVEYIEYIEPNYYVELFAADTSSYIPNDPYYITYQWGLQKIGAMAAYERGLMGEGVKIGIIDSGINSGHEDLDASRISGMNLCKDGLPYSQDSSGHGTFIAGIISAQTDNGLGLAGIAPCATIMAYRVFSGKTTTMDTVVSALYRAVDDGCDIVNLSLGTSNQSSTLRSAVEWAQNQGVVLIAAVGNNGSSLLQYPAAYPGVIGVGSVDADMTVSQFSQRNRSVDVTAPGGGLPGLDNIAIDGYKLDLSSLGNKGTSYSAPIVSAMAALALGYDGDITTQGIHYLLQHTADDAGAAGYDTDYGYGIVNIAAFIDELQRSFSIHYELNGGVLPVNAKTSYRVTDNTIPLPEPTRPGWTFIGWYGDESTSGSVVTTIPAGSLGDVTLYAAWQSNESAAVKSISINGIFAQIQENETTFEICLPFGTDPSKLTGREIAVQPVKAGSSVSVPQTTDGGNSWRFTITGDSGVSVTYTLFIRMKQLYVAEGQQDQTGTARPASMDTLTAALPYTADASTWFRYDTGTSLPNDFACVAWVEGGAGTLSVNGSLLTYMPAGEDAGKRILLHVKGTSGGQVTSAEVTVAVIVDAIPWSQPVAVKSTVSFDRDTALQVEIPLVLFDQIVSAVWISDELLEAGYYSLREGTDSTSVLAVDGSALAPLPDGFYTMRILFDAADSVNVILEITSSMPRHTVTFQNEDMVYSRLDAVYDGESVELPAPPTRQGYIFDGWYTEQYGGTQFTAQTPVYASLTVYARWRAPDNLGQTAGAPTQNSTSQIIEVDAVLQFTRVERWITAEQSAALVAGNGKAVVELRTEKLRITVPVGTLPKGFDVNLLMPDESGLTNAPGQVLSYVDENGARHIMPWVVVGKDGVSFTARNAGAYEIIDASMRFDDVLKQSWYEDGVLFASARGLLLGVGQAHFSPESLFSRGMMMTVLARLDGVDTSEGAVWYEAGAQWAMDAGVSDGSNPNGSLTREQAAAMLWRYVGAPDSDGVLEGFADAEACSDYAVTALNWAVEQGILNGKGNGRLDPRGDITRAELAVMLMRFVETMQYAVES